MICVAAAMGLELSHVVVVTLAQIYATHFWISRS